MPLNNSRFIVFEGLDGAGTTTQAAKLQAHFTRRGTPSFLTNEPTSEPIGTFIRRLLTGREAGPDGGPYRPGEHSMGLLFAADRLAHSRSIQSHLDSGEHVVCDRYLLSSMAYQTLDPDVSGEWVVDVNYGCAVPDVTVFIAVPVDVCLARVGSRGAATSIYETKSHLETIARNYEALLPLYASRFGRVLRIDGTASVDDTHARIVEGLAI
ncbi:MAG TPA: dTMP kinase [Candidatus Krumholzibacteria bacterium]|nr:dTMP kinase [Candidatus Krumholzibacteria bacterium]